MRTFCQVLLAALPVNPVQARVVRLVMEHSEPAGAYVKQTGVLMYEVPNRGISPLNVRIPEDVQEDADRLVREADSNAVVR